MKLNRPNNRDAKVRWFDAFAAELAKVPFGTLGKRDLECLILHLLVEQGFIDATSSRGLANALGINETRLKGYLVDIRYKYKEDQQRENIAALVKSLFAAEKTKLVHENGSFVFALEDPVLKLDFEQAMKDVGYYTDSSFNREVVKVRDYALVAFLFRFNHDDHTFPQIQALIEHLGGQEHDLASKIDLKKSWLEIGRDLLDGLEEGHRRVQLLRSLAGFLG